MAAGQHRAMRPYRIDLVYIDAGGGHRAAANALRERIELQRRPWQVRLRRLPALLDPQQRFERIAGFKPEAFYNQRLARGWTLGLAQELKLLQAMIRLAHPGIVRALERHWCDSEPDLVVSLIPNFNRALRESVARSLPGVPFVTVMTDMADHPPSFWIEPGAGQHLVCGTPRAFTQALAAGLSPAQLSLVSGMVLRPAFDRRGPLDAAQRAAGRAALGLDAERSTAVVMFGGAGSASMLRIARLLPDVQLILLCGRNDALVRRLRALPGALDGGAAAAASTANATAAPRAVLGFRDDIASVMALGDFFIGKPGPGALSEAVQAGLPVVTFRNRWTMPQERYNTEWVRTQGVGLVLPALRALPQGVERLLQQLQSLRARVAAIDNHAAEEVVEILARLLEGASHPSALAPWRDVATRQPAEALG